ncbi:MAG: hypothetical protein LIO59_01495 [Oscillospiraceae bacterium]|nr:hypothetical protein [Oscillospiraceae bacterium]
MLLEGTYNISAQISLASKSNITIEGQGAGTILTTTSDIDALYLYHSTGCRISSLAITTSVESPADGCAISSDNADNNIISNCIIDGNYNL